MAIIPSTTRFIGISPSVDLTEKKSAQINSETEPYTMADISATVGGGVATVVAGTNVTVDNADPLNPIVNVPVVGAVATVVAGDGVSVDSTDPANPIVNAHKLFSGVFAENSGVALALTTERNDFDSTSPLIATRLGVGYYVFTFTVGSFNLNSSSTVYSFQSDPSNGTVSLGFYSADTQGSNQLYIFARDTTGAMADGLLNDVEFRMVQLS
tara:strand:- start:941 stop:1576 length:636 start_codon:yes stop_codon:yes gene_type:complete